MSASARTSAIAAHGLLNASIVFGFAVPAMVLGVIVAFLAPPPGLAVRRWDGPR